MCCYALLLLLIVRTNFSEFSMLNQGFLNLLNYKYVQLIVTVR